MSDKGKRSSIRLSHEQQQMVEDNIGLVGYAIGHYGHQGLDTGDDTFQIGVIGLIQAVATYDPDRSIKFSTYAIPCILNELRREARRQMRGRGMILISLDKAMSDDATLKELLPDDAPPIDEHVSNHDLVDRVMQLLEHSDTTAARLTLDYLMSEDTQRVVGQRHGVSQPYTSRSIRKTLRWLRKRYGTGVQS